MRQPGMPEENIWRARDLVFARRDLKPAERVLLAQLAFYERIGDSGEVYLPDFLGLVGVDFAGFCTGLARLLEEGSVVSILLTATGNTGAGMLQYRLSADAGKARP